MDFEKFKELRILNKNWNAINRLENEILEYLSKKLDMSKFQLIKFEYRMFMDDIEICPLYLGAICKEFRTFGIENVETLCNVCQFTNSIIMCEKGHNFSEYRNKFLGWQNRLRNIFRMLDN